MVHLGAIEYTRYEEVHVLGELAIQDVLAEGKADVIACGKHTVGRCWQSEGARLLHVLHQSYFLAGVVYLTVAVSAY